MDLGNYSGILTNSTFVRPLLNSIGIGLIATFIAVVFASMAAYTVAASSSARNLCRFALSRSMGSAAGGRHRRSSAQRSARAPPINAKPAAVGSRNARISSMAGFT